ncbi:MAG: hypothetical protein HXY28_01480 [Hydrogenophilaceae bacterium]|jgi:hypothetical protein|nr:hypothetical protein [Hydrogenophilaceae bacterium]
MRARVLLAAALIWAGAGGAPLAQEEALSPPLTAAEIRAAILGHELSGVTAESGIPWMECITPEGDTVYRFGPLPAQIGRVQVTEEGQACFSYAESGFTREACWTMRRRGERLQFDDAEGVSESFLVLARPRVNGCSAEAPSV